MPAWRRNLFIATSRLSTDGAEFSGGELTAVNLQGRVRFDCSQPADGSHPGRETDG